MFCIKCNKEIPDNSTFCQFCGVSQAQAVQQHTVPDLNQLPEQEAEQIASQNTYNAPATTGSAKKKSKAPLVIIIAVTIILVIALAGIFGQLFSNNGTQAKLPDFITEILDLTGLSKETVHIWKISTLYENIEQEYHCKGDKVESFTQVTSVKAGIIPEDFAQMFTQQSTQEWERIKAEYPFIEYSFETVDGEIIETYKINDVGDHISELEQLKAMYPEKFTFPTDSDYVSYEQIEKMLKVKGFTEVQ